MPKVDIDGALGHPHDALIWGGPIFSVSGVGDGDDDDDGDNL